MCVAWQAGHACSPKAHLAVEGGLPVLVPQRRAEHQRARGAAQHVHAAVHRGAAAEGLRQLAHAVPAITGAHGAHVMVRMPPAAAEKARRHNTTA